MKYQRKRELESKSIESLNSIKSDLGLQLFKARVQARGTGFRPVRETPIKLVSNIKKQIAVINTFINQKNENN